eukprot:TRINITY_DN5933_c0_g1_i2.p1 TRINITY_DN5933_c0_g1~~TRINITY_DN5933_c0_g1_i2.p1  ORF type:complete len:522 (-),score=114.63 TRINITY_DN5933_c0_g1_i2:342-1907(-)
MKLVNIWNELTSMLYWTMLAACTVGPGTVVTCARAGAEYDLSLIWALVFASVLAYTLQEGTARLTIVSGKSLGQCLRVKYRHGAKIYDTAVICWLVGVSVFIGNTLYECNNWAGGIDAILAIPGSSTSIGWKVGYCLLYAAVVITLLVADKTEMLGIFLGIVMMAMVALFLCVVVYMDINLPNLGRGFLPNIPAKAASAAEPTDIIISLVGTTSIGFNLFLGGSMAKGKSLRPAQRGIGFSTASAFVVSVLILIVGSGNYDENGSADKFRIADLANKIEELYSTAGVVIFGIGFIAAALSSMLTVPLGAALTADSVFSDEVDEADKSTADLQSPFPRNHGVKGVDNPNFQMEGGVKMQDMRDRENKISMNDTLDGTSGQKMPRWVYISIMVVMVCVATIVNSCIGTDERTTVILIAQVFNGVLLPFFSLCLLLCINDAQFMGSRPQTGWANVFLLVSVTITLFLASNVIIQKIVKDQLEVAYKLIIAACCGLGIITSILTFTTLGKDILTSFRNHCWTALS